MTCTSTMPRTKPTDLSDEAAMKFLEPSVPISSSPKNLWLFLTKDGAKRPGVHWPSVEKLKHVVSDILDATGGRCLRQVRFAKQLTSLLLKSGIVGTLVEVCALLFFEARRLASNKHRPGHN